MTKSSNKPNFGRRSFVTASIRTILSSTLSVSFGQAIASLLDSNRLRIGIIYATRYGATADNAAWIAAGINQNTALYDIETTDVPTVISQLDYVIAGSGIWREGVHPAIQSMMTEYASIFNEKLLASFIVCGTLPSNEVNRSRIAGYFHGMHNPLRQPPPLSQALGGRLRVEKLSHQDHQLMLHFYQNILKTQLTSWDRTDPNAARNFGQSLKSVYK